MEIKYIQVTEDNMHAFSNVLPGENYYGKESVIIGATLGEGRLTAGTIVISQAEDEYIIQWLYVLEELRHYGIGSGLLAEANTFIEEIGVMPVVCQFPVENEEYDELLSFFNSYVGERTFIDTEFSHERYITEAKDFYTSEDFKNRKSTSKNTPLRFYNQTNSYKKLALSLVEENLSILDRAYFEKTCIPELCLTTEENGHPTSILLSQMQGEYIVLSYLYGKNPKDLYMILCAAAEELEHNYSDKKIMFDIVSNSAMALSTRFFKNAKRIKIYEAQW